MRGRDTVEIRSALVDSLAEIEAGIEAMPFGSGPTRFIWRKNRLWLDRIQGFLLREANAEEAGVLHESSFVGRPPNPLVRGRVLGGVPPRDLLRCLAQLVAEDAGRDSNFDVVLNCTIMQARVNPPFKFLFWFVLEQMLRRHETVSFMTRASSMMYDLSMSEARRPSKEELRSSQIAFVKGVADSQIDSELWGRRPELEWTRHCGELFWAAPLKNVWLGIGELQDRAAEERTRLQRGDELAAAKRIEALSDGSVRLGSIAVTPPVEWIVQPGSKNISFDIASDRFTLSFKYNGRLDQERRSELMQSAYGQLTRIQSWESPPYRGFEFVAEQNGLRTRGISIEDPYISDVRGIHYSIAITGRIEAAGDLEAAFQNVLGSLRKSDKVN